MRGAAATVLLLLSGCTSWFEPAPLIEQAQTAVESVKSSAAVLEAELRADSMANKAKAEEAKRKKAETESAETLRQLRMSEQAHDLSNAGLAVVGIGVLAFLFAGILVPRWVSATTVVFGLFISTFCYQVLEFLGTKVSMYIMGVSFGVLAFAVVAGAVYYIYDWVKDHT